jgi:peroxiredoxin Q/BCP
MSLLKIGEKAPDFNVKDQNGNEINLASYRGEKVILFFYPKADTPGCTAEACNLRDNNEDLLKHGFKIIGVSADEEKKQLKFGQKYDLPFPLIPDTDKKIINDYGVWGPKKFMGREYEGINRTTYVIDENGNIEKVFAKVKTKDHTNQILNDYNL